MLKLSLVVKELVKYRTLLMALVTRHLAMRYRGSALGFLWSFLNPLCLMLVYAVVFKYYIRFDNVDNYTVFLFCGLLPWIWTQSALIEGANSIVSSGHLITKSMFPAHVLPSVSVLTSLFHFLLSLPLLFLFMVFYGLEFHSTLLLLPLLVGLQTVFLFGICLSLASFNVQFRDVQHIVANVLTFLFFLCPILYPRKVVPEAFQFTLDLNPFALFIDCYHQLVLDGSVPSAALVVCLVAWTMLVLFLGVLAYESHRDSFAELL